MAEHIQSSVIIPVYNKWELTEMCLRSLEQVLAGRRCEVIVIDNASADATGECCPGLGERLFGSFFRYHRAERNLNFGPASNLGARMARGEYVLLLNNDTCALPESPDWYDGLIRDFSDHANIAASGPVLLYPPGGGALGKPAESMRETAGPNRARGPFGATVQHLGVFVSPNFKVAHLYEGIPASSPLAGKRRFFQIITAACMLMPRALFLEHGGFDETYINGFEDVDLCARLWAAGWRMTVNPRSRLYHFTSQTPGRNTHEEANARHFGRTGMRHLTPDWHLHLAADGLELQVTEWLSLGVAMPGEGRARLAPLLRGDDAGDLRVALERFPLWYEGYARLAELLEKEKDSAGAHAVLLSLGYLRPSPEHLRSLLESARRMDDEQTLLFAFDTLCKYSFPFENYMHVAEGLRSWAEGLGLEALAGQLRHWLETADSFRAGIFRPFLRELRGFTQSLLSPTSTDWAYAMWRELHDSPERRAKKQRRLDASCAVAFSVLLPVTELAPERLRSTVASLLAQQWPHWEACLVAAASAGPGVRPLLEELGALDPRIRVNCPEDAEDMAALANAALDMAGSPLIAVIAQGDRLTDDALMEMASLTHDNPDGLLFHSDEDRFSEEGAFIRPYCKNSVWDWDLLLGRDQVSQLGVYRADRLRAVGGFSSGAGKAWAYDLLLRYTEGLESARIIHTPKILYHVYVAAATGEESVSPEASADSLRAVTRHLERTGTAGSVETAPGTRCFRVRYSLPKPSPLVSLVVDVGADCPLAPALTKAALAKAGYGKLEVVLLYDREAEAAGQAKLERWAAANPQARLLPLSRSQGFGERANAAVRAARGSVIGFLGKGVIPLTQDWLVELVSRLLQPGVGVVGGRLVNQAGVIQHIGHLPDGRGRLFSLFRGLPASEMGRQDVADSNNWAGLARSVTAMDPRCFFTRKRLLEESEGLDAAMGGAAAMDFCLKLRERGLRTVATPFVGFLLSLGDEAAWEKGSQVNDPHFLKTWSGRIRPCNPQLDAGKGDWTFAWDDAAEEGQKAASPAAPAAPVPDERDIAPVPVNKNVLPAPPGKDAVSVVVSGTSGSSGMRENAASAIHNKSYFGTVNLNDSNSVYTQMYFFLKEHCDRLGIANPRVLEVGCNTGYFSRFIAESGAFVYGVEPFSDEALRQGAVDGFFHGTVESFMESEERKGLPLFDAAIFGDVLEHLMDPESVLLRVADCLKPDGVIIASVPNVAHLSVRRMLDDGQWLYRRYGLLDSTHRYFFTRHSLRKLLIRTGFGIDRSHHVLAPLIEEYAPGLLDGGTEGALNERDHTYQIVVRASRPALAAEAFTDSPPRKVFLLARDADSPNVVARIVQPLLYYCHAVGGELRMLEDVPGQSLLWADILVIHGVCSSRELSALREARSLGISTVYDFNTLLHESMPGLDPDIASVLGGIIRHMAATADRVTCATDRLRAELMQVADNPFVVPDAVCERPHMEIEKKHRDNEPCTFVLASDSEPPPEPVLEALRRFFAAHPGHALVGMGPVAALLAEAGLPVVAHDPSEPGAFARVLLSLDNPIGLLPLPASLACSCTSAVMFHRFTLCGLVSIASGVAPYCEEIENGKTGLLADNTADGWLGAMKALTDDAGMRRLLLARAVRHCRDVSLPDKAVAAWRRAFHGLPRPDEKLRGKG